jgi:hypothetical protein
MLSDSALKCRFRLAEPTDGVDEAVVEVHEAFEDARERVRSSVEVAGDESAEKWLPVA